MTRAVGKFMPLGIPGAAVPPSLSGPLGVPTPRLAAVDIVRARVTATIALGILAPGERLPDPEVLAESLDVSLITVRRALESLCREGLLDRRRGRTGGTFVSPDPDPERLERIPGHQNVLAGVRNLVGQRILVECGVVALAAHVPHPVPDSHVAAAPTAFLTPGPQPASSRATALLEVDFHLWLAGLAGVDGAVDHVRSAIRTVAAYMPRLDDARAEVVLREHADLAGAVRAGDPQRAIVLMRSHVERLHQQATVLEGAASTATP